MKKFIALSAAGAFLISLVLPGVVVASSLDIVTGGGVGAFRNQDFSVGFTIHYDGTYPLSAVFSNAPPGLSASLSDGVVANVGVTTLSGVVAHGGIATVYIAGKPTTKGTWNIGLVVSDGYGLSDTAQLTISVGDFPVTALSCLAVDNSLNPIVSVPINTNVVFGRSGGDINVSSVWTVSDADGAIVTVDNSGFLGFVVVKYSTPGYKTVILKSGSMQASCVVNITGVATSPSLSVSNPVVGYQASELVPLIRLYNHTINNHFYTTNRDEAEAAKKFGYKIESEMGHLLKNWQNGAVALHRLYNPKIKKHFYTTDGLEAQTAQNIGYRYEGVLGYMAADLKGELGTPVYRMYNSRLRKHFYTSNLVEYNTLIDKGFSGEGSLSGWMVLSFR